MDGTKAFHADIDMAERAQLTAEPLARLTNARARASGLDGFAVGFDQHPKVETDTRVKSWPAALHDNAPIGTCVSCFAAGSGALM